MGDDPSSQRNDANFGRGITAAILLAGCVGIAAACSSGDRATAPIGGSNAGGSNAVGAGGSGGNGPELPCIDGTSRDCHVTVGKQGDVMTCLIGQQSCVDGSWTTCEGSLSMSPIPPSAEGDPQADDGAAAKPLSLGAPTSCTNNPCDPACRIYDEIPNPGVQPGTAPGSSYNAGSPATIPVGFIGNGLNEPCSDANDCQFDMICQNPASQNTATGMVCSHSKCASGAALEAGCDTCVDSVCAVDPLCCGIAPPTGTCSHGQCQVGEALAAGCDSCVDSICAANPLCCSAPYATPGCAHEACDTGVALAPACDACVGSVCAADPSCCPATFSPTCAHSACTLGGALSASCDSCVDAVCTKNPGCCGAPPSTFNAACTHSLCATGTRLTASCDTCAATICAADPYCCNNMWDAACVAQVNQRCAPKSCNSTWTQECANLVATTATCGGKTCTPTWDQGCVDQVATACGETCEGGWTSDCVDGVASVCGQSCPTFEWNDGCVDKVGSVCGAACEPSWDADNACAHDPCFVGDVLAATCSPCVAQICASDSYCCTTSWDSICQSEVASICGGVCGDCAPWPQGQTDPTCSGVDLTVGVPCTGSVPICNRGNAVAPAGVQAWVYPANEPSFGQCNPDLGSPPVQGRCTVAVPIPPGTCIDVQESDCVDLASAGGVLLANRTVMVNPPIGSASGEVAECRCENNWSDYHTGTCTTYTPVNYVPGTYTQLYTADCPPGTRVQWGFLAYDATTPGDSSVQFQAHTADTAGDLAPPLVDLATAQASPNTQVCGMTGPAPCPINLFSLLGSPSATQLILELVVTLNPTSSGTKAPTLNDWQITYSCPATE